MHQLPGDVLDQILNNSLAVGWRPVTRLVCKAFNELQRCRTLSRDTYACVAAGRLDLPLGFSSRRPPHATVACGRAGLGLTDGVEWLRGRGVYRYDNVYVRVPEIWRGLGMHAAAGVCRELAFVELPGAAGGNPGLDNLMYGAGLAGRCEFLALMPMNGPCRAFLDGAIDGFQLAAIDAYVRRDDPWVSCCMVVGHACQRGNRATAEHALAISGSALAHAVFKHAFCAEPLPALHANITDLLADYGYLRGLPAPRLYGHLQYVLESSCGFELARDKLQYAASAPLEMRSALGMEWLGDACNGCRSCILHRALSLATRAARAAK